MRSGFSVHRNGKRWLDLGRVRLPVDGPPKTRSQAVHATSPRHPISRSAPRHLYPEAFTNITINQAELDEELLGSNSPAVICCGRQLTARIKGCSRWEDLQTLASNHIASFDCICLSTALAQLGKLVKRRKLTEGEQQQLDNLAKELVEASLQLIEGFDAQGLVSVMVGLAKLDYDDAEVFDQLVSASKSRLHQFNPQALSLMLWALARAGYVPEERWLKAYYAEVSGKLDLYIGQDVSNTCWGITKLQLQLPSALLDQLAEHVLKGLRNQPRSGRNASTVMTCFVRVGYCPSKRWMSDFQALVQGELPHYIPMDLVSIIYHLVKLDCPPPAPFMEHFYRVLKDRVMFHPELSYGDFHRLLWALSRIDYTPSKSWLDDFVQISRPKLKHLKSSALTELIWTMSCWGCKPNTAWLSEFLRTASVRLNEFRPTQLALVALALADLGCRVPADWILSLVSAFRHKMMFANTNDVVSLLEAMPMLDEDREWLSQQQHVLMQLSSDVVTKFEYCDMRMLVELAGSFSAMQFFPGKEWAVAHQQACIRCMQFSGEEVDAEQLQKLRAIYGEWDVALLPPLVSACEELGL